MKKALSVLLCIIVLVSGMVISTSATDDIYPRIAISDATRNQDWYVKT